METAFLFSAPLGAPGALSEEKGKWRELFLRARRFFRTKLRECVALYSHALASRHWHMARAVLPAMEAIDMLIARVIKDRTTLEFVILSATLWTLIEKPEQIRTARVSRARGGPRKPSSL